jgi:hypothetical protein
MEVAKTAFVDPIRTFDLFIRSGKMHRIDDSPPASRGVPQMFSAPMAAS